MKLQKNLKILDKNAHWWAKTKTDWATQDKDGHWWIIPGSEFPEKQIDMKTKNKNSKMRSSKSDLKICFFIAISSFLGVTLAALLLHFVL